MPEIEKCYNKKLNLTFYRTEDGRQLSFSEVMFGPYRLAKKGEDVSGQLLDLVFYDSDGNPLVPIRLFGP